MLPFRYQILGYFLVAFVASLLLGVGLNYHLSLIDEKSRPFESHSGMLMVTLQLNRDQLPKVMEIKSLSVGRISIVQPGNFKLSLLDKFKKEIYALPFNVIFLKPGEPPKKIDQVEMILVIPDSNAAQFVSLSGPTGSAEMEIKR